MCYHKIIRRSRETAAPDYLCEIAFVAQTALKRLTRQVYVHYNAK